MSEREPGAALRHARRAWRTALLAAVLAALTWATFLVTSSPLCSRRPRAGEAPRFESALADIPRDWKSLPIKIPVDMSRASVPQAVGIDLLQATRRSMAPVADVFVEFEWDVCTAGGSACSGTPPTLHDVRAGDLDWRG